MDPVFRINLLLPGRGGPSLQNQPAAYQVEVDPAATQSSESTCCYQVEVDPAASR